AVLLDGEPIAELPEPVDRNEPHTVELAPKLSAGTHELEIQVTHFGASVVAAAIEPVRVGTGTHWLARGREGVWRPAALAEAPVPPRLAEQMTRFEPPARRWLAASAAFSLLFAALLWRRHRALRSTPAQFRTLLLAIWALVAGNNFLRLPSRMGMDFAGHLEYVQFIVERGALPLANDGWQTFQSPLYYVLCAGIASLFGEWNGLVIRMFRLISIACALAQIEIAYRLARRVFPERDDLQKIAILVSGLLPMGFCISQGIGNEPLHGALGALTLLLAVRVAQREGPLAVRDSVLLGAVFGLALLAKVTAALLAVPLLGALAIRIRRDPRAWRRESTAAVIAGLASVSVAGWYYARNWLALGTPFVAGWLPRQTTWWQEPGYRMVEQLTGFGTALVRPFLAAIRGFWDGYYSTLWADGNLGSIT
ncbi:MAG: glycosyltransferase family 39 protein, partial [Myxococcota bacterium]